MGTPSFTIIGMGFSPLLAITLLYLAILGTGAQSVTANRDTWRSDGSDEYKGVQQQGIIKY